MRLLSDILNDWKNIYISLKDMDDFYVMLWCG